MSDTEKQQQQRARRQAVLCGTREASREARNRDGERVREGVFSLRTRVADDNVFEQVGVRHGGSGVGTTGATTSERFTRGRERDGGVSERASDDREQQRGSERGGCEARQEKDTLLAARSRAYLTLPRRPLALSCPASARAPQSANLRGVVVAAARYWSRTRAGRAADGAHHGAGDESREVTGQRRSQEAGTQQLGSRKRR